MDSLSAENKEAVDYLINSYKKQLNTLPGRINQYKKKLINKPSHPGLQLQLKQAENQLAKLPSKLNEIQVNPEKYRNSINSIKQKFLNKKKLNTSTYPIFPTDFTNGSRGLEKLWNQITAYGSESKEKEDKIIKDIQTILDLFVNQYSINRADLVIDFIRKKPIYKHYTDLLIDIQTFFEIKENFGSILTELQTNFTTNYSIFINWGSGGHMSQILPQDKSFKAKILTKYPKHLFLIFDKSSEAWHGYNELFQKSPDMSDTKNPHTSRIEPIQKYLEVMDIEYTKLSDKAFQYIFHPIVNGISIEICMVFFDSYISNFGFYALEPLIEKSSLSIAECTTWPSCNIEIFDNYKYILNHFDYYITQYYSKFPIFNNKNEMDKIESYNLFILDLHSLRNKEYNKNIYFEKEKNLFLFNTAKMNSKGVTYKQKGNSTYWNIIRGGKQKRKTRKTKRHSK